LFEVNLICINLISYIIKYSKMENVHSDYEILPDEYPNYDLSFKLIIMGNSGKFLK